MLRKRTTKASRGTREWPWFFFSSGVCAPAPLMHVVLSEMNDNNGSSSHGIEAIKTKTITATALKAKAIKATAD